jgi:O-antigen ligase
MDIGCPPQSGIRTPAVARVHAGLLTVALMLLPLGGLTDGVGLALLGCAAVAALPQCLARWRFLISRPTLLLWASWWILAFASISWSSDPGDAMLHGGWGLLAVPAMVPVIDQPLRWLWPLGVGVAAQTVVQLLGWVGMLSEPPYAAATATGGLYPYLPLVGLWAATSVVLLCPLSVTIRAWPWRIVALTLVAAAAIGILLTMNRSSWGVVAVGLILIVMRCARFLPRLKREWRSVGPVLLVLVAVVTVAMVRFDAGTHASKAIGNAYAFTMDDQPPAAVTRFDSSVGRRVLWWRAGWELLQDRPFVGHGAGSIERSLALQEAEMPSQWGAGVTDFITSNPHATLVATAIEQGGLGVVLLLSMALGVAIGAWRRGRTSAELIGLGPAWIALLLFSITHAVLLEPYTSVLVSILLVGSLPVRGIRHHENPSRPMSVPNPDESSF